MGRAFPASIAVAGKPVDWRKRMSDTVAYALLVYTGLQILVTMRAIEGDSGSLLPLVALVVLVAGIIPLFRHFERRWENVGATPKDDPVVGGAFRRDRLVVWLLAIGVPFVVTGLFKVLVRLI